MVFATLKPVENHTVSQYDTSLNQFDVLYLSKILDPNQKEIPYLNRLGTQAPPSTAFPRPPYLGGPTLHTDRPMHRRAPPCI